MSTRASLLFVFFVVAVGCRDNEQPIKPESVSPQGGSAGATAAGGSTGAPVAMAGHGGGSQVRPLPPTNPRCGPNLPGPTMVEVTVDKGSFCIDSTEVTQAQYKRFLDEVDAKAIKQRDACAKNTDFSPIRQSNAEGSALPMGYCTDDKFDPSNTPDNPMVCVEFCDAAAYCEWAGKRLCGKLGGGPVESDEATITSEWGLACSQGGATKWATGDVENRGACPVSSDKRLFSANDMPACHGQDPPYRYLNGLDGGAYEWDDYCEVRNPWVTLCHIRGGDHPCAKDMITSSSGSAGIGFRCCKGVGGQDQR